MKKFTFSLQTVLRTKEIFKKQKQAEYSQACSELERLLSVKRSLAEELRKCGDEYSGAIGSSMTAPRIEWYYDYSGFISESITRLDAPIRDADKKKDTLREQLISLTREADALEKLQKEQYRAYLAETAKEEEKVLGDLMSYKSAMKQGGPEPE